jgi:hypothetical protein
LLLDGAIAVARIEQGRVAKGYALGVIQNIKE